MNTPQEFLSLIFEPGTVKEYVMDGISIADTDAGQGTLALGEDVFDAVALPSIRVGNADTVHHVLFDSSRLKLRNSRGVFIHIP